MQNFDLLLNKEFLINNNILIQDILVTNSIKKPKKRICLVRKTKDSRNLIFKTNTLQLYANYYFFNLHCFPFQEFFQKAKY